MEFFDYDHYMKVYKELRKANKLSKDRDKEMSTKITNTFIKDTSTGVIYYVEKVIQQWNKGWYFSAVLKTNTNSHRICYVKNVNCHDESTLQMVESFKKDFCINL